jgi:hypothetical protein
MIEKSYSQLMADEPVHLILKLDTKEPIEIGDFVGAFTAIGNEFDRYIRNNHPDLKADALIFVREVRSGCIEADMFPHLSALAGIISQMDQMLIIEQFVRVWGKRLSSLISGRKEDQLDTKSELRDFGDAVAAIARDPDASSHLEAAYFHDGEKDIKAAFKFKTPEARKARDAIEKRKRELDHKENSDHERVLMNFTRSDVGSATIGKRSGEKVQIEKISDRPLPLMYGSNLAEQRIKHEIREADDNIYKKGFSVDVNVETRAGKPTAYSVTHVHQVFDLPDD